MSERKGFFSFFRGKSKAASVFSEEEEKQRSYAIAKEQEEKQQLEKERRKPKEVTQRAPRDSTPRPPREYVQPEPKIPSSLPPSELSLFGKEKLEELLRLTLFGGQVLVMDHSPEKLSLDIVDSDDTGRIIGKDGATLEAIQTLLRGFIYKKFGTSVRVTIDIGDYRKKKEEILQAQAVRAAKTVLQKGRRVELKNMNSEERRLIHTLFQNDESIRSFSVGDGNQRRVVLEQRENAPA